MVRINKKVMTEQELLQKIYDECTYFTGLNASDLNPMPEQYEHGKIDGIHDTAYAVIEMIEKYHRENVN